jgi:hypothetical protein
MPEESEKNRPQSGRALDAVLAPNGELFRGFDPHLDAPARASQQGDLDGTVGEKLRHGHVGIRAVRRLDDDGFISSAAEN